MGWSEDVRYAVRALGGRPLYALASIAVLAIAIGANTTVFSVFNGLFLRPLPYPDGDRLVMVYDSYPKMNLEYAGTAIPDYIERREQAPSLENLAIITEQPRTLTGDGPPQRVRVGIASASLFDVLRVAPVLGRVFTANEEELGNERVVVLSHALWRSRFGGQANIVDSSIRLDGDAYRVIGVMPEGFGFMSRDVGAYVPFAFTPQQRSDASRGNQFSNSVGRLRDGATVAGLESELATIVQRNVAEGRLQADAVTVAGFMGRAEPLRDRQVGDLHQTLLILQAVVLTVLLIACANLANLQLTRLASRRKELAVRAALGAAGGRIVTMVLIEALLLSLVGGVLGVAVAWGGLELVGALGLDRSSTGFNYVLDATALSYTLGAAVVAGIVSGLPPVLALLREDLTGAIREGGRQGGAGRGAQRMRGALVVAQLAMSVTLLVGAGLLTKSFYGLLAEGPGFSPNGVWTARYSLGGPRYTEDESWPRFQEQAVAALRALPGVSSAGVTSVLPFSGNNNAGSMQLEGYEVPNGAAPPHANYRSIDDGYFATLGLPILAGRNFAAHEAEPVAIVDETLAAKYWPNGSPLGQRLRADFDPADRWFTIIGVVPTVKQASLAETEAKETVYWHYEQRPQNTGVLALRTVVPPSQLSGAAGAAITAIDPDVALSDARTLDDRVEGSLGPQRAPMVLTLVFAAVAFVLAVIGIYGVLAWGVSQRVNEIGVRMALGARAADIGRMILRQGGKLIAIGLVLGVAGALGLGRVLSSQLERVGSFDATVLVLTVVGLGGAALVASWLPARRASRVDPMNALRSE
ncbi:MAG TPA: ABC transporter permease [Gammaproteobacteria bacterium]|nr:ABC transporter permease [Gammaproteobacteria bacterium]